MNPGPPLNENVSGRLDLITYPALGVRDKEDLRPGLLALRFLLTIGCFLFKDHRPCCDRVLDLLAADLDRMLGDSTRLSFGLGFSSFFSSCFSSGFFSSAIKASKKFWWQNFSVAKI